MSELNELLDQNQHWVSEISAVDPEFFVQSAKGQSPKYLWIGCADSRVPATEVTGTSVGDLFVHRNIANVVSLDDPNCMSVIEYAVLHLKVEHVIVCGHYGCGGVQAAFSDDSFGRLDPWLAHIKAVKAAHADELSAIESDESKIRRLCELNVLAQVAHVTASPPVQDALSDGQQLEIHGLIYDLATGRLTKLS